VAPHLVWPRHPQHHSPPDHPRPCPPDAPLRPENSPGKAKRASGGGARAGRAPPRRGQLGALERQTSVFRDVVASLALLCPHGEERLDLLRNAVAHFELAQSPVPLAAAFLELGGEHAFYCQSAPEAVKAFRRAADIAYRCGLGPVMEGAIGGLHRAGARPRRLALSGPDALTPAELRVASLAAAGCTNAQISSRLYLSNKTVEGHLLRVFRKLGISSRHHLGDHLTPSLRVPGTRWT
jgi:DNA-binding CsgD family transcriptional regulator